MIQEAFSDLTVDFRYLISKLIYCTTNIAY